MHEDPDGAVVDLQAPLRQFRDQPAPGERLRTAALDQPDPMLTGDRPRIVPAHLAGGGAARLTPAPYPIDRRADADPEALCRRPAGQRIARNCTTTRSLRSSEKGFAILAGLNGESDLLTKDPMGSG